MNEQNELATISLTFDRAFAETIGEGFEKIRAILGKVRDDLVAKYTGDNIMHLEIAKCELERLLVGAIKSGQNWKSCFEIYKSREARGFQSPVRRYLVLQMLLDLKIPQDAKTEVATICDDVRKELENLQDGSRECLQQLSSRVSNL